MSLREILRWPDARLSRVCDPVADVADVQGLIADLFDTMYAAPGRGLAAPQIGVMARVFVMDIGWKEGRGTPMVCINPEIVAASREMAGGEEGCLSIPGIGTEVVRPAAVTLGCLDESGARCDVALEGFAAKCAQHELDHLDGVVTFDRLDACERATLLARYEALA